VSLREDNSPEAVERRRAAREAILERARQVYDSRQRSIPGQRKRGASFDDLVDDDGKLRDGQTFGVTATGADAHGKGNEEQQLRNRSVEAAGRASGAATANPFADEMVMSYNSGLSEEEAFEQAARESRTSSVTLDTDLVAALAASVAAAEQEHAQRSIESQDTHPQEGSARSETSESEVLIDLTPTTSRAPSSFHPVATPGSTGTLSANRSPALTPRTPRSTTSAAFETLPGENIIPPLAESGVSNFQSIHEWAESSTASFYSPPESEAGGSRRLPVDPSGQPLPTDLEMHDAVDAEVISRPESRALEDMEVSGPEADHSDDFSEAEVLSVSSSHLQDLRSVGMSTPGTWTEVGSVVSEDH
jgi:hypothetical protein